MFRPWRGHRIVAVLVLLGLVGCGGKPAEVDNAVLLSPDPKAPAPSPPAKATPSPSTKGAPAEK